MGTLTADCPRLEEHCPHKLATSCRLTSTPNCCACADERPHSRTYRVYIDGIGFVQRGTRWQGYCWFCKEFWNNRLAATDPPLETSQTQIPQIPDQTEFLDRWFEFHKGYRIVRSGDGSETRIAVTGEPLKDVSPGYLPRTLDQLRAGRQNDAQRAENRFRSAQVQSEEQQDEGPRQTLDEALDSLLEEASDEETDENEARRDSGDQEREMDSAAPDHRLTIHDAHLSRRSEEQLQRVRERLTRVFGTREEIQQDDYESPLSTMYNRAWGRYRQAEERRATGDTTAPSTLDNLSARERREIEDQLLWGVLRESRESQEPLLGQYRSDWSNAPQADFNIPPTAGPPDVSMTTTLSGTPTRTSELRPALEAITAELSRLRQASEAVASARHALHAHRNPSPPPPSLDNQPGRPAPMTDEQMTKNLACQVCYSQIADTAVLPCGHMVMCQWCADVVIPVKHSHLPVRPSKCPMCRKQVKQRFKIHVG